MMSGILSLFFFADVLYGDIWCQESISDKEIAGWTEESHKRDIEIQLAAVVQKLSKKEMWNLMILIRNLIFILLHLFSKRAPVL